MATFLTKSLLGQLTHDFAKVHCNFINTKQTETTFFYLDQNVQSDVKLPTQQSICLFYLVRGKTLKEIAALMGLSIRTVESYIEEIKNKFNCHSKSALIEKAHHLGYLHICLPNLSRDKFSYF